MVANSPSTQPVRFGLFEFDAASGELRKQGLRLKLRGQPLEILALLLARPGEVVTRDELQRGLWHADTFVDFEHSLNAAMKRLRAALGDSAETPRFIETVARRGYRFIAPVDHGTAAATPVEAQHPLSPAVLPSQRRHLILVGAVVATGLVIAVSLAFGLRDPHSRVRPSTPINSLVVLPLKNLSGSSEDDYFANGMTDELRAQLASVSALRVISQTSSLYYKGANKTLGEIAGELDVDAVVEGSVLRSGDRVRINVQLIQAVPERRIWGQSYERSVRGVLSLQSEVARTIVDEIRVKLTAGEKARLSTARASNPEAHLEYVKGRFFWNKRTEEGLRKSIAYFQSAIDKDPGYALAYAGLADSWVPMAWYAYVRPGEAFPQAKQAVMNALRLDPGLAEAHTTLAFITLYYDWDWAGAEREFRRAIELNPNYANAHHWYAEYLSLLGRHEAAIQESERARDLDPLSSIINTWVGSRYFCARRYDMAIEQYRSVAERDPSFVPVHLALGQAYEQKAMLQEAIAELRRGVELSGGSPVYVASLAHACGLAGRADEARRLIDELQKLSQRKYVASVDIAAAFLGLGEKNQALTLLEKAVQERSPRLLFLGVDPRFDVLRSDARFQLLAKRVVPSN
jgi:TolB-like protein/DNA-binding winged helix-turn-helix (wHTH) protein/Flp pilus assembly protein TadD